MAERLTDKNHEAINKCGEFSSCYSCKKEICYITEVCEKLGKLEDILEKYGIDIQNLDYILEDYSKNQGRYFAICEEIDYLKKDRDTWKRACELASETLKQVMGKPLWIGGNIPAPEVKDTKYFYQQAKTEGNNE